MASEFSSVCLRESWGGVSKQRKVRTVRKLPGETFLLWAERAISQHGGSYLDSNTNGQKEEEL